MRLLPFLSFALLVSSILGQTAASARTKPALCQGYKSQLRHFHRVGKSAYRKYHQDWVTAYHQVPYKAWDIDAFKKRIDSTAEEELSADDLAQMTAFNRYLQEMNASDYRHYGKNVNRVEVEKLFSDVKTQMARLVQKSSEIDPKLQIDFIKTIQEASLYWPGDPMPNFSLKDQFDLNQSIYSDCAPSGKKHTSTNGFHQKTNGENKIVLCPGFLKWVEQFDHPVKTTLFTLAHELGHTMPIFKEAGTESKIQLHQRLASCWNRTIGSQLKSNQALLKSMKSDTKTDFETTIKDLQAKLERIPTPAELRFSEMIADYWATDIIYELVKGESEEVASSIIQDNFYEFCEKDGEDDGEHLVHSTRIRWMMSNPRLKQYGDPKDAPFQWCEL